MEQTCNFWHDILLLFTVFVNKLYKKDGLQMQEFNRIINCKCSEMRLNTKKSQLKPFSAWQPRILLLFQYFIKYSHKHSILLSNCQIFSKTTQGPNQYRRVALFTSVVTIFEERILKCTSSQKFQRSVLITASHQSFYFIGIYLINIGPKSKIPKVGVKEVFFLIRICTACPNDLHTISES